MNGEEENLSDACVVPFEVRATIDDATQSLRVCVTLYGINNVESAKTQLSRWKNGTNGIDDRDLTVTVYVNGIQIISVVSTNGEECFEHFFVHVLELIGQKSGT